LIDLALDEDLGAGDVTTEAVIPDELQGRGVVMSKAAGVLAGVEVARAVFRKVDAGLDFKVLLEDGSALQPESYIAEIDGPVSSILKAERTAINYLQRLSGIATDTSRYVQAVDGHDTRILDTRKTTPGLRVLEKYAVSAGGGHNHRRGLGDGVLIKDNHIEAMRQSGVSLGEVVARAREAAPHYMKVEVEVEDVSEAREALDAGAEILLLDNMGLEQMAEVVKLAGGRAATEASGGITLDTVQAVAATGVDSISVGALTHSAKALDISLDLVGVA
jgi:nicotinate-nucleotide pyrophosphorylase (carboxylating)